MSTEPLGDNNYEEPYEGDAGGLGYNALDLQVIDRLENPEEPAEVSVIDMDPALMEELRGAVSLGDDDLISHDIWFVTTGASSLNHAGMKAFLAKHRKDIRGAFMVNLDSVGRGELTMLANEGSGTRTRADRRLGRLLSSVAEFFKIDLARKDYKWEETEGTPAIQKSVRVTTLMGMDKNGLPASSHTSKDEPEYLDDRQIANVTDIVAEMIRRS